MPGAAGVTGLVRATFITDSRSDKATVGDLAGYTPSDPASAENTLRVREKLGAAWVTILRAKWQLAGNTVTPAAPDATQYSSPPQPSSRHTSSSTPPNSCRRQYRVQ